MHSKYLLFKGVVLLLILSLSLGLSATVTPDLLYSISGFASLNGGYENFVATAETRDGKKVVFGGGNHATGEDLKSTFPWISSKNGKLSVGGFNDMMVKIDGELYTFNEVFSEKPLTFKRPEKALKIVRNKSGKITNLYMEVEGLKLSTNEKVSIAFHLKVKEGHHVPVRRAGLRSLDLYEMLMEKNCPGQTLANASVSRKLSMSTLRQIGELPLV